MSVATWLARLIPAIVKIRRFNLKHIAAALPYSETYRLGRKNSLNNSISYQLFNLIWMNKLI